MPSYKRIFSEFSLNSLKEFLIFEFKNICSIKEGHELPLLFFRLYQVITLVSVFYLTLVFLTSGIFSAELQGVGVPFGSVLFMPLLSVFFYLILSEIGLRFMRNGKIAGFWIGLILSLKATFSLGFLLGLFGIYSFLNPSFQKKHLQNAPTWFKEFLSTLKINFTLPKN